MMETFDQYLKRTRDFGPATKQEQYVRGHINALVEYVDLVLVPSLRIIAENPLRSAYGFCPHCRKPGVNRERRLNGNDTCAGGHVYPSSAALVTADG